MTTRRPTGEVTPVSEERSGVVIVDEAAAEARTHLTVAAGKKLVDDAMGEHRVTCPMGEKVVAMERTVGVHTRIGWIALGVAGLLGLVGWRVYDWARWSLTTQISIEVRKAVAAEFDMRLGKRETAVRPPAPPVEAWPMSPLIGQAHAAPQP